MDIRKYQKILECYPWLGDSLVVDWYKPQQMTDEQIRRDLESQQGPYYVFNSIDAATWRKKYLRPDRTQEFVEIQLQPFRKLTMKSESSVTIVRDDNEVVVSELKILFFLYFDWIDYAENIVTRSETLYPPLNTDALTVPKHLRGTIQQLLRHVQFNEERLLRIWGVVKICSFVRGQEIIRSSRGGSIQKFINHRTRYNVTVYPYIH